MEQVSKKVFRGIFNILNVCSYVDSWIWTRFCRSTLIESFIVDEPFVEVEETQTRVVPNWGREGWKESSSPARDG